MKKLFKQIAFIGVLFLISVNVNFQAQAGCFGTSSFYTCNDSSEIHTMFQNLEIQQPYMVQIPEQDQAGLLQQIR